MRRRVGSIFAALFAATAALSAPVPGFACSLSVGWNDWEPYIFRRSDGNLDGLDVRLVTALLARIDCTPDWRERPWARIVAELRAGQLDMAPWATVTDERKEFALFSRMYLKEPAALISRRDVVIPGRIESFADLAASGLRFSVENGAAYSEDYKRLVAAGAFGNRLIFVTNQDQMVQLLLQQRVDAIINTPISTRLEAAKLGREADLLILPFAIAGGETHFMFSRKTVSEALRDRIDAALAEMLRDGSYDAILKDYDPSLSLRPPADAVPGNGPS